MKLQRAREHLDGLEAEIGRWLNEDGCVVRAVPDPQPPRYAVRIEFLRELDLDRISLLVGDVLQNARAALDHLAFALGDANPAGPMTDKQAEDSGFPIVGDTDRDGFTGRGLDTFLGQAGSKLANVVPEARAVIQQSQPFQEAPADEYQPLWILNELARIDRHRFLHVTVVRTGDLRLNPGRTRNAKIESLEAMDGPLDPLELKQGAQLAELVAHRANPQAKLHLHFDRAVSVTLGPDSPEAVAGDEIVGALSSVVLHTSLTIGRLTKFLRS